MMQCRAPKTQLKLSHISGIQSILHTNWQCGRKTVVYAHNMNINVKFLSRVWERPYLIFVQESS